MSFPKRSVAAPCLCIKSGIIWTCDWCIPVVPHPNNRTCTHYTGDRRASNVRFCLGASGRKANIRILDNVSIDRRPSDTGGKKKQYGFASLFAALLNGYSVVLARLSILITNLLGSL